MKTYANRTCIEMNGETSVYREEMTKDEFENYLRMLSDGYCGCYQVTITGPDEFVALFRICGEKSVEVCRFYDE